MRVVVGFAHPDPAKQVEGPPPPSPADIAASIVQHCDGSVFMEHTLRVDHVGEKRAGETDPKRSIFGVYP